MLVFLYIFGIFVWIGASRKNIFACTGFMLQGLDAPECKLSDVRQSLIRPVNTSKLAPN
jgi:hypothetical protein